jgi:hypothetical protein
VPRQIAGYDTTPRRRRSAKTVAIEADEERGFAMRLLLRNPKDVVAGVLAFAAVSAIVANALFLQKGHHPSPIFGAAAAVVPASPLPRPRPAEADMKPAEAPEAKAAELRATDRASDRASDPLANLVRATSVPTASNVLRPPAPIPAHNDVLASNGSRRVAAVQRVLTENGYGQLKATGTVGADTQAAIQKFERDRKIPVTGQMSDRLVRELVAMTGHPID